MRSILIIAALLYLAGCSTIGYDPPTSKSNNENRTTIPMAREPFWKLFVSQLSTDFFVINNLDKETGLINVSYTGDPQKFVDCGRLTFSDSTIPAAQGTHNFNQWNEMKYWNVSRQMQLEGRINIIVEELDRATTGLTVNTRYILNRRYAAHASGGHNRSFNDTASFNYGQEAAFVSLDNFPVITCRSTGALQRQIVETGPRVGHGR